MGQSDAFSSSSLTLHGFVSCPARGDPCTRVEHREPQSVKSRCVHAVEYDCAWQGLKPSCCFLAGVCRLGYVVPGVGTRQAANMLRSASSSEHAALGSLMSNQTRTFLFPLFPFSFSLPVLPSPLPFGY